MNDEVKQESESRIQNNKAEATLTDFLFFWILNSGFCFTSSFIVHRFGGKMKRDLVREFLAYLQVEKGLARASLESYGRDLARLEEWASAQRKSVESLTRKDLRGW